MRLSTIARACALVLGLGPAAQLPAQGRQPLVLQHGFLSNAGTWDQLAPWLEQYMQVSTSRYSTGWNSPFHRQSERLRNSIAHLPDTTILVGHSNGGIVSRRVATLRRTKGFVTVGTPHRGAPLAASVVNGTVNAFAAFLRYSGQDARAFYGRPEFDHHEDWMRKPALVAAGGEEWLGILITGLVGAMNLLDDFSETVLTDMVPGSAFLSDAGGINSLPALNHEAATVGGPRVAFNSSVRAGYFREWLIWKGLAASQSGNLSIATDATILTLLAAHDYYASYGNPGDPYAYEKRSYAPLWLWAAGALIGMDVSWCALIGASAAFTCEAADGIVPVAFQKHPGPGAVNIDLLGPAHQEQINSTQFRDALMVALRNRFQVGLPGAATHPLSVSIEGTSGTYVGNHTNTVYAVGGSGPYSYRWYISADGYYFDDTGVTGASYTKYVDVGQLFWIKVVVTAGQEQASATKTLGPVCPANCS